MHNQFKTQKFKHLMLAMDPRDLNSAPYSPVHCSSHSMTSFQSSELTELPVVENSQLFAQSARSACTARAQRAVRPHSMSVSQPPPMFPKACKHKKVFETWKFRFTPMFSRAMKHEKPTNVRLGNPSCDHTHIEGAFEDLCLGLGAGLG